MRTTARGRWWSWAVGLAMIGLALGVWGVLPRSSAVAAEGGGEPDPGEENPFEIKMYVAYARYDAEVADEQVVQVPDGWTVTITLADGTNGGDIIKTEQVQATKLPKKIECFKEDEGSLIVDFVYSDDQGAWDKFLQAWEQDYHIIAYIGHANSGQYFDIGPNVGKTSDGEHKGEPKNGYVVLKETVPQTPVALYVGLSCYPEIPHMMLDSACVRIKNKYPNVKAIGHRKTSLFTNSNKEIAAVISAVLNGKEDNKGQWLTGLDVLPDLEAEDIGIDDEVTEAVRDARRALFTQNGASAIWHNLDSPPRKGYGSAWKAGWHPYTQAQLAAGAQGQPLLDGVFDDSQDVPINEETPATTTTVCSAGPNGYLETVACGDDVYEMDSSTPPQPIAVQAGVNLRANTRTTCEDQFWAKFLKVTEGSSPSTLDLQALLACLIFDAFFDHETRTFQTLLRYSRE